MSQNRMPETRLRENQEIATREAECRTSNGHLVLKVVGGVVLALAVTAVLTSLHDIRRYLRIVRM